MQQTHSTHSKLPHLSYWLLAVELVILVASALSVSGSFLNPDPLIMAGQGEFQYITSSALAVSQAWQRYHYIPLWQPYYWMGEPLIEWGFSTVLNPFSTLPSLLYGGVMGLKISAVLHVIIMGIGGWVLARVLGMGTMGRLMLGLLLIARNDLPAYFEIGFFQLGVSQAFIPYTLAGAIALFRFPNERYPIPLMGVGFALILWTGNIYYVLPAALFVLGIALLYIFPRLRYRDSTWTLQIHMRRFVRFIAAGAFAVGLSACVLLPAVLQNRYMQGHPGWSPSDLANYRGDVMEAVGRLFDPDHTNFEPSANGVYSFVAPLWFVVLVFVVLPPIGLFNRSPLRKSWRIWLVGLVAIPLFITWSVVQNPVIEWLYDKIPFLSQWRFIGRMMSAASMWVAILIALRFDGLWRAMVVERTWQRFKLLAHPLICRYTQLGLSVALTVILIVVCAFSLGTWNTYGIPRLIERDTGLSRCLTTLRQLYGNQPVSTFHMYYGEAYTYIEHQVRLTSIGTGIYPGAVDSTIFSSGDLGDPLTAAPIALAFNESERLGLIEHHYTMIPESYRLEDGFHCAWARPDALSYAFTIGRTAIDSYTGTIPASATTVIQPQLRVYDQVNFVVTSNPDDATVLVAHERAYPGWHVEVDGLPVQIESVGGLIGVVLPPENGRLHTIHFYYRPSLFVLGGWITLFTFAVGVLYLLRADQLLTPRPAGSPPRRLLPRISPAEIWQRIRDDLEMAKQWWNELPDDDEEEVPAPSINLISLPAQTLAVEALPAITLEVPPKVTPDVTPELPSVTNSSEKTDPIDSGESSHSSEADPKP